MLLLAFLDSPGIFFVLATIGIVNCTFGRLPVAILRPVLLPFLCTERPFRFRLDGTERNGNITIFLAATVCLCVCVCSNTSSMCSSHMKIQKVYLLLPIPNLRGYHPIACSGKPNPSNRQSHLRRCLALRTRGTCTFVCPFMLSLIELFHHSIPVPLGEGRGEKGCWLEGQ